MPRTRRRKTSRIEPTLWLAQAVIAVFRVYVRGMEVFGSKKKRDQARRFREKITELNGVSRSAQEQIKQGKLEQGLEQLEKLTERSGDYKESQSIRESRLELKSMREDSEALKQIRSSTGEEIESAIAGYQKYIQDNPGSHLAFTYLGGDLRKAGRFEDSLAAYRHVIQLKQEAGLTSPVTYLSIGNVLKEMGRLDDAIAVYQVMIESNSADSVDAICGGLAYLQLGDVLKLKGEEAKARDAWKQAVKLDQTGTIKAEVSRRLEE